MNLDDIEERSASAGEYVLGTLDRESRERFEQSLQPDRALQAEVYAWQDRLLGLAVKVAPLEPSSATWLAIEARLQPVLKPTETAPVDEAANDPLWQRLRRWPFSGVLAVAASMLLATVLLLRIPTDSDASRYLAVLQAPADQSAGWIVEATAGGALRLVPIAGSLPVPPGKTLQFWTKAEGAAAPTSLGLVTAGQVTEVPAKQLPTLEARQLFELTLEPEGGSPIGRPTGPIVYVGRTVLL